MKQLLILLFFFVAACRDNNEQALPEEPVVTTGIDGERLFKANCASCHKPENDFTGPPIKGSLARWGGDKKAMYDFIKNPAKSITENAYAKKLFKKWKTVMTSFELSDAQIDAITDYCENYVNPVPGSAVP